MNFQSQLWFDPLDTPEIRRLADQLAADRAAVERTVVMLSEAKKKIWRDKLRDGGIILNKTVVDIWESFGNNSIAPANFHGSTYGYIVIGVTENGYVVAKLKADGSAYESALTSYGAINHVTKRKRK